MFQEFDIELPTETRAGKSRKAKDRLPVPQGKLVVKKLSPREAEKMKRLGISAQEIVPENLEAIALSAFKQVSKEVAVDNIAGLADTEDEMMAELTQKVSGIKHKVTDTTIDIDSLPEDKKKEYLSLIADHLAKYKAQLAQDAELAGLPQNLAQSVRDADDYYDDDSELAADAYVEFESGDTAGDDVDVAEDIESAVSARGAKKRETDDNDKKDSDHQHVGDFCARCGFPKNQNLDIMQVSKDEEERYLVAAATLSAYEQTRKALGGRIEITFRTPSVDDEDAVWLALSSNTDPGRSLELVQRYRLTLQVKSVKLHDGTVKRFPGDYASWCKALKARGLKDVSLDVCWQSMKQSLAMSNSLKNVLFRELFMFNGIVQRLENLSAQENIRNF